ncbi:hypothetical protein KIN20_027229 [Parelaphostrongylus tenuis]|uniref:EGF-like domain-containing protein n=1 Tax=Parelaphostrongylus tenuis TaxID=148309 RepID=A0AAD5WDV9_PARTN|nr:hypothetical protein KIN20_027229 [Parelaphostrongylus tenuis]
MSGLDPLNVVRIQGLPLEKCADINECELNLHNCEKHQMCQNKIGGFTCVHRCSIGYQFVDGECVDIDECRLEGKCDRRAECTNTPGGYECKCDEGLTGDGKHCSPITDCSQNEEICDRHAFCIKSLKLCLCQTGYVGDGITCNDVNECLSIENACENQKGDRCVNINGGYVCCKEGLDDDQCIRGTSDAEAVDMQGDSKQNLPDHGAFCAGGCGLHAICFNQTCQCMEGFFGDPHTRCIDVNECESNEMCAGVGQWCVNKIGGHICCSPDSKEPECQGLHVFKTSDGEIMLQYNNSLGDVVIQQVGFSSQNYSGGAIITRRGFLKYGPLSPSVNVNRRNELLCTSYCPAHSECVDGVCRCMKGFGGNPLFGCEDVDECITSAPCPVDEDSWCVNTFGSYHCCNSSTINTNCIGLEIAGKSNNTGRYATNNANGEAFLAASLNESLAGEVISQITHEVHNFSTGEIVVVKNKEKTNVFEAKPKGAEVGLEIVADFLEKDHTTVDYLKSLSTSTVIDVTTSMPPSTVVQPDVPPTRPMTSAFTTSVPISEIPIHRPTSQSSLPAQLFNASSVNEVDGSGLKMTVSDQQIKTSTLPLSKTMKSPKEERKSEDDSMTTAKTRGQMPLITSTFPGTARKPFMRVESEVREIRKHEVKKNGSPEEKEKLMIDNIEKSESTQKSSTGVAGNSETGKKLTTTNLQTTTVADEKLNIHDSTSSTVSSDVTHDMTTPKKNYGIEKEHKNVESGFRQSTVSVINIESTTLIEENDTIPSPAPFNTAKLEIPITMMTAMDPKNNEMESTENEVGLEIIGVPTTKHHSNKSLLTEIPIAIDGSGEELNQNEEESETTRENIDVTKTTVSDEPTTGPSTTQLAEKVERIAEARGKSESFIIPANVGSTSSAESGIDEEIVGLEIVHMTAAGTTMSSTRDMKTHKATPDAPELFVDEESGDKKVSADRHAPVTETLGTPEQNTTAGKERLTAAPPKFTKEVASLSKTLKNSEKVSSLSTATPIATTVINNITGQQHPELSTVVAILTFKPTVAVESINRTDKDNEQTNSAAGEMETKESKVTRAPSTTRNVDGAHDEPMTSPTVVTADSTAAATHPSTANIKSKNPVNNTVNTSHDKDVLGTTSTTQPFTNTTQLSISTIQPPTSNLSERSSKPVLLLKSSLVPSPSVKPESALNSVLSEQNLSSTVATPSSPRSGFDAVTATNRNPEKEGLSLASLTSSAVRSDPTNTDERRAPTKLSTTPSVVTDISEISESNQANIEVKHDITKSTYVSNISKERTTPSVSEVTVSKDTTLRESLSTYKQHREPVTETTQEKTELLGGGICKSLEKSLLNEFNN